MNLQFTIALRSLASEMFAFRVELGPLPAIVAGTTVMIPSALKPSGTSSSS